MEEREEPWEGMENREGRRVRGVESGGVERRESGWRSRGRVEGGESGGEGGRGGR